MKTLRQTIIVGVVVMMAASLPRVGEALEPASLELPVIISEQRVAPPAWALYQRQLIDALDAAGVEFFNTYVGGDGTVTYKERYEGGMNSSDDVYEAFKGFSLATALGGSYQLDQLHRQAWEGITRQFTRYGQIYREFDSNWDWMHHGEGYVSLYPMGMVEPEDSIFRDRAVRFAAMYIGDDAEAPNYNKELRLMRAVMNGSRGPKMEWTKRDWIPTNANLTYYPLPFDDIPGIDSPVAWINDHPDNDLFGRLIQAMSDRMAKGDVPINLTVTPLIANAYLYTGDERYVDWVKEYVSSWQELTDRNNGITPDNVGLSGEIGEYTGNWWGGYYGWVWPRGGTDIVLAEIIAAKVATLLTGESSWLELPRSQMAVLRGQGEVRDGRFMVPIRHDHRGWYHYVEEPSLPYVNLWLMSQEERDWRHIERLAEAEKTRVGRIEDEDLGWAYFLRGLNPGFPERVLQNDLKRIAQKIEDIQGEHGDSETWVDNKWINVEPMVTGNLTRLSVGGVPVHVRGEMLHSQLRYFDGERRRAGLPPDVAALITRVEPDAVEVEIVNLNVTSSRLLVVQGGAYGEHRIQKVDLTPQETRQLPGENSNSRQENNEPVGATISQEVAGTAFAVQLAPGSGMKLRLHLERHTQRPSYSFPWDR